MSKVSIRFFEDKEVRAIWNEEENKWYFNIVDICSVLTDSKDPNAYWRWLKRKLLKENNQTVSDTHAFKFIAADGKRRLMDAIDSDGIIKLAAEIPSKKSIKFLEWFTYSDNTIDGQSKKKAYSLFESNLINEIEIGTIKGLQQIHDTLNESTNSRIKEIGDKIKQEQDNIMNSLQKRQSGEVDETEYIKISRQAMKEIDSLNMETAEIEAELGRVQLAEFRKEEIIKMLESGEKLETFDETIFRSLVKEIKALSQTEIEITYNCGLVDRICFLND